MFRILTSVLVLLAVSACGPLGLPSAVDAIPFEARPVTAPFADGVYCGLDDDEADNGKLVVRTTTEEGDSACTTWTWDAVRRVFVVTGESGGLLNGGDIAVAELGDGLLLMQFPQAKPEDDEAEKPWAFLLWIAMDEGEAVALVPLSSGEEVRARASAYPDIVFSRHGEEPAPAPEPPEDASEEVALIAPPAPVYYISAGDPEDIRTLARDIIVGGMRDFAAKPAEERNLPEHGVIAPVLVRDTAGIPDHPPTAKQLRDVDALMKKLLALGAP